MIRTGLESEPAVRDLLAIDPHSALVDFPIRLGRTGGQTGLFQEVAEANSGRFDRDRPG